MSATPFEAQGLNPMLVLGEMAGGTRFPADLLRTSIVLSWAREHGRYPETVAMVMAKRREWLTWLTLTQRDWQTKVSRRPARGRHHDSWGIRENYVRCR